MMTLPEWEKHHEKLKRALTAARKAAVAPGLTLAEKLPRVQAIKDAAHLLQQHRLNRYELVEHG